MHKCFHINKANYLYIYTYAQMLSHKLSKLFVYRNVCHKRFHINNADYLYIYIRMHKRFHINKANYVYIYIYVCTNAFT